MLKSVIIIGTSRSNGNTRLAVDILREHFESDLIDLNDYQISYYDYGHGNSDDDYLPLMKRITDAYDLVILATPVYWYSMSGVIKVFFDRLTDLLEIDKDTGRRLRGKKMAVVSTSLGDNIGDSFWLPFKEVARYLGMTYTGNIEVNFKNAETKNEGFVRLREFAGQIISFPAQ